MEEMNQEATTNENLFDALDVCLFEQSRAAQQGDAQAVARLSEGSLQMITALSGRLSAFGLRSGITADRLLRYRDLALYTQLLLRYTFTGLLPAEGSYDIHGQKADYPQGAGMALSARGVL